MKKDQIKILIIEDNRELLDTIVDIITMYGSQTYVALNVKEAIKILIDTHIDLVISDINLPGESGFQLLDRVKRFNTLSNIPFIFITGDHKRETFRKGMISGAKDFITKPFTPQELVESIDSLLKREIDRLEMVNKIDAKMKEINHVNSHDLRHSLSKFSGLMNLINEDEMSIEDCKEYFNEISEEMESGIKRMNQLINNQIKKNE